MKHPKRDVYMETTKKIVELLEAVGFRGRKDGTARSAHSS